MSIRFANGNDAEKLLNIYNQYIDTSITFEYDLPTVEEFEARIKNIQLHYPYIVFEENSTILGYAYAHEFGIRAAYQWGAELSVYIDKNYHHKHIGTTLYNVLINILKLQNIKTVYGCITEGNIISEDFHTNLGFNKVATFSQAGFKNNSWLNVVWYEKKINGLSNKPKNFISIKNLDTKLLKSLLMHDNQ